MRKHIAEQFEFDWVERLNNMARTREQVRKLGKPRVYRQSNSQLELVFCSDESGTCRVVHAVNKF